MTSLSREFQNEDSSGIDLTPMLDVVFIMLIFFIVTASFIREATIQIDRPVDSQSIPVAGPKNMFVELLSDNQIVIDGRRIDHRSIRACIERHLASNPDSSLILHASNTSKTFAATRIADAAREAGMIRVVLANLPDSNSETR